MVDVIHYYDAESNRFVVKGKVLRNVRIKPYMREMKFRAEGSAWVAQKTPDEIAEFFLWCEERGWTVDRMKEKPHQVSRHRISFVAGYKKEPRERNAKPKKVTPAKTNNVYYNYTAFKYGKVDPSAQLRGGGLQHPQAKEYIQSKGFHWVFRRGRRMVAAYEAPYTPHKLIEILLHLKMMGLDISPSPSLHPKRWLYLDLPKIYEKQTIKTRDTLSYETLMVWLEKNGYARIKDVEQPGDFAIKGDSFYIWTKQDDALVRLVFDGDTVESISQVDPETFNADYFAEVTINGLVEIGTVEPAKLPTPAEANIEPTAPAEIVAPKPVAPKEPTPQEPSKDEAMAMYADLAAAWLTKLVADDVDKQARPAVPAVTIAPQRPAPKYKPAVVMQMTKKFAKLDADHPFFGMVKFNDDDKK